MAIFCFKKLKKPVRLGECLKKAREEKGISLIQISKKILVGEQYLKAIEENRFIDLPESKAYRISYIRAFAKEVGVDIESDIINYSNDLEEKKDSLQKDKIDITYFYSLSNILRKSLAGIIIILFAVYLIWQVKGILEPPKLIVFTPVDGYVTSHLSTLVQGETEEEGRLTINGQEVRINEKGQFEFSVDLVNGLNTIVISATKKHGKTNTIRRYVVSKQIINGEK